MRKYGNLWAVTRRAVTEVEVNSVGTLFFITPQGLHRSLDNGDTWEPLQNGLPTTGLSDLLVAPNDHVFLFGAGNLLYRSVDEGLSWLAVNNGQSFINGQCLAANAAGVLFMGMGWSQIQRSYDDGDTWTAMPVPAERTGCHCCWAGDTLFAGNDNRFSTARSLRSIDGGDTWSPLSYGLGSNDTQALGINQNGYVFAGTDAGSGLVRSVDGGSTWTQLDIGEAYNVVSIKCNSIGHMYISSFNGGVLRSTDNGDTWSAMNNGLTAQYPTQLAINASDHLYAATSIDLFRSTDGGAKLGGIERYHRTVHREQHPRQQ
ncbi:MAG: hypothetical protein IPO17_16940 [Flavobacteriales bacterium]|nr:hypothetical protein [Flavobacteriales bacterium]